jgi:hypothetical protein
MLDEIYFFFNLSYFGLFVVEFARRPRPEFLPKLQNFDVRPKEKHPLEYTIIMKFGKFLPSTASSTRIQRRSSIRRLFAGFYSSMIHIASRLSSTHNHAKETEERHDAAIDEVTSYHKSLPWHFVVQHGSNSQNGELMTQVLKQENLRA